MSDTTDLQAHPEDDTEERVLRQGFGADPLSNESLLRIRAATEVAWRANSQTASRPWRPLRVAAAAIVLAVTLGATWFVLGDRIAPRSAPVWATLTRFDDVGVIEHHWLARDRTLLAGDALLAGQVLHAQGAALVTLMDGGTLRLAPNSEIRIESARFIELLRGMLYLDIPPSASEEHPFIVKTPAGNFSHMGTQFELAVQGGRTQLRVREGRVYWRFMSELSEIGAGTLVAFDKNIEQQRRPAATAGRDWTWTEALAPDIAIENRSLADFLTWVARETGRRLVFADSATQQRVTQTTLHGSTQGQTIFEALSTVMASTSFRFDLVDGAIRVSSGRERQTLAN